MYRLVRTKDCPDSPLRDDKSELKPPITHPSGGRVLYVSKPAVQKIGRISLWAVNGSTPFLRRRCRRLAEFSRASLGGGDWCSGEAGHESFRLFDQPPTTSPIQKAPHRQRQLLSVETACKSSSIRSLLLKPPLAASRHSNAPTEARRCDHQTLGHLQAQQLHCWTL